MSFRFQPRGLKPFLMHVGLESLNFLRITSHTRVLLISNASHFPGVGGGAALMELRLAPLPLGAHVFPRCHVTSGSLQNQPFPAMINFPRTENNSVFLAQADFSISE